MEILGDVVTKLERALDIRMVNQRVIASNLANIDTPGFTAQKMDFETSLNNAIAGAQEPVVIQASQDPARALDGNNVDLDGELAAMGRNKLMFQLTSQILAARLRQVSTVLEQEP